MRWIVDGMNVIGSRPDGWWRNRGHAMAALVERLEQWAAAESADVTVVFERPLSPRLESSLITVTHAPKGAANSADDEIVRLVRADSDPRRSASPPRIVASPNASRQRVRPSTPRNGCATS